MRIYKDGGWIRIKEAAERYGVPEATLRSSARAGQIRSRRFAPEPTTRVHAGDVEAFSTAPPKGYTMELDDVVAYFQAFNYTRHDILRHVSKGEIRSIQRGPFRWFKPKDVRRLYEEIACVSD